LHPTQDEIYHSALTELMQAAVTSNHCGQHTRNHETPPTHLILLALPSTAGLTFTLPASLLHVAGRTTGDAPQAFGKIVGNTLFLPKTTA